MGSCYSSDKEVRKAAKEQKNN